MRRVTATAIACCVAYAQGACDEKPKDSPAAPAPASVPAPTVSVAPAPPKSPLALLATAKQGLRVTGQNGGGIVLAGSHGLVLRDGKLAEHPTLHQGLENPKWTELALLALGDELAVLAGKRDPSKLWTGDFLIYMEDKEIGPDRTVFRSFQKGSWVRVGAVSDGEVLRGLGRYRGRIVAAVEMPGATDYRFALIAGKPGIGLPAPSATDKPKEAANDSTGSEPVAPAAAPAAAAGDVDAAGSPALAPSASAAPAEKPPAVAKPAEAEKPRDPALPHPDNADCATRLVPRAFDGLEDGEAVLAGRVCPGTGAWWIEHWDAGKRKASFEPLPTQPSRDSVVVAAATSGQAYLAELGSRLLLRRSAGKWAPIEAPGSGDITELVASSGGRVWLIVGGKVWSRSGDAAWVELPLPDGKSATSVLPSDGELTLVAAGNELYGPPAAAASETVQIGPGATALCTAPYVIVQRKIERSKRYPEVVERVAKANVAGVELVFGHRGMAGEDSIQAKAADMKTARALAAALGGADIVCGAPRTEAKVPAK